MNTPIFLFILVAFVASGAVLLINLFGTGRVPNYFELGDEDTAAPDRLDALRIPLAFYGAGAVLLTSFAAYMLLR
jgi:hypothetical protein